MKKALLLPALLVPLFSSGLWADPPLKISMVTLRADSEITAEIESMMRDASLPKFAEHYPLDAPLREWILGHRSGRSWFFQEMQPSAYPPVKVDDPYSDSGALLLMITTFESGKSGLAERRLISNTGLSGSWLEVYNHAIQQNNGEVLSANRLLRILSALEDMPEQNEYPSLEELAIVSYRRGDEWFTRTFYTATVQNLLSLVRPDYQRSYLGITPSPIPRHQFRPSYWHLPDPNAN